jgi:hypothetical protein
LNSKIAKNVSVLLNVSWNFQITVGLVVGAVGKIKCAAIWVGLWGALQLFLFCEALAFVSPLSAQKLVLSTVAIELPVTFSGFAFGRVSEH